MTTGRYEWAAGVPGGGGGEGDDADGAVADWPLWATLTNGRRYGVDLVVWATGVQPNTAWLGDALVTAADGGVAVDRQLRTNVKGVFAAGDVASCTWVDLDSNWFQMRLWTQVYVQHILLLRSQLCAGLNLGREESEPMHEAEFMHVHAWLHVTAPERTEFVPCADRQLLSLHVDGPEADEIRLLLCPRALRGCPRGAA